MDNVYAGRTTSKSGVSYAPELGATPRPATKIVKPKPLTWKDNPKHCNQKIEWIAKEPPFRCIKKKTAVTPSNSSRSDSRISSVYHGCGDNQYANFIYMKESGCNLGAINSIGCRGIGQACPGSKLPCGADYVCQNRFFTSYAIGRYGSWYKAYQFWLHDSWW